MIHARPVAANGGAEHGDTLLPAYIRAKGDVRLGFAVAGARTILSERADGGGYLVRTPRARGVGNVSAMEAVLINTGGGMAGGDRLALSARSRIGASALITTQAAEKVYRSQGPPTKISVELTLDAGSRLDWLPQETILFCGSRLRRRLNVAMASDCAFTAAEMTVFGRIAMEESFAAGRFDDRWRIRREGRLIFADDVNLDGAPAALLAHKASGGGARAVATILHVAPDAESRLDGARELLDRGQIECGASAWNGMLLMRFADGDARRLRSCFVAALEWLRGKVMPRCW